METINEKLYSFGVNSSRAHACHPGLDPRSREAGEKRAFPAIVETPHLSHQAKPSPIVSLRGAKLRGNLNTCNPQQQAQNTKSAFTLVELMIVVAILGILAAVVVPAFQDHVTQAKEAAAKDNLRVLREAINRYAIEHNDIPPGYPGNDPSAGPSYAAFLAQITMASNASGAVASTGTAGYPYGPYLKELPNNPFNNSDIVSMLASTDAFPSTELTGVAWIYKPSTKEIRINKLGTDTQGASFSEY